jgi:hypothetical protein
MGEQTKDADGRRRVSSLPHGRARGEKPRAGCTHVQLLTPAGTSFDVVKPAVSEPMLEQMMTIMRFAKRKGKPL